MPLNKERRASSPPPSPPPFPCQSLFSLFSDADSAACRPSPECRLFRITENCLHFVTGVTWLPAGFQLLLNNSQPGWDLRVFRQHHSSLPRCQVSHIHISHHLLTRCLCHTFSSARDFAFTPLLPSPSLHQTGAKQRQLGCFSERKPILEHLLFLHRGVEV